MMAKPTPKLDQRPRFGWCANLNNDPQVITEFKGIGSDDTPVAVLPMPICSAKRKAVIRKFVNGTLWPKS